MIPRDPVFVTGVILYSLGLGVVLLILSWIAIAISRFGSKKNGTIERNQVAAARISRIIEMGPIHRVIETPVHTRTTAE
jgi:Na+-transporting methylmalonyl-CoA/oxaloacetate decarboxylase gamma subunit